MAPQDPKIFTEPDLCSHPNRLLVDTKLDDGLRKDTNQIWQQLLYRDKAPERNVHDSHHSAIAWWKLSAIEDSQSILGLAVMRGVRSKFRRPCVRDEIPLGREHVSGNCSRSSCGQSTSQIIGQICLAHVSEHSRTVVGRACITYNEF